MPTSRLCFGPYNDPGGPTGKKHCDLPHDPSYLNPAFSVRKANQTYTASVAVRNVSSETSPTDVTVSFYGCGISGIVTASRVNTLIQRLLSGSLTNMISGQSTFSINPASIAPFSSASDHPWVVGPVSMTPQYPKAAILVATLTCPSWSVFPMPGTHPTQDPCVAVWVGP